MSGRQEYRTSPPGGSSRRVRFPGSDSGFESLDGDNYYRSPPANSIPPPFTDADVAWQWNNLTNLQRAYRELWENHEIAKKMEEEYRSLRDKYKKLDETYKSHISTCDKEKDSLSLQYGILKQKNSDLQQENAHLKAVYDQAKNELDDLRATSSETSSSSRHQRTSSSSKENKPRENQREKEKSRDKHDKDKSREKNDRERERNPNPDGLSHLKQRFESRPPQVTQQIPSRTRRPSVSYDATRPQVHVSTTTAFDNYHHVSSPAMPPPMPSPGYSSSVPRATHPTVTVTDPFSTYPDDGIYRPQPLPPQTQNSRR